MAVSLPPFLLISLSYRFTQSEGSGMNVLLFTEFSFTKQ